MKRPPTKAALNFIRYRRRSQKLARGQAVGAPYVPIADVGGEDFKTMALRVLVCRCD
jgi:hypothetical protein